MQEIRKAYCPRGYRLSILGRDPHSMVPNANVSEWACIVSGILIAAGQLTRIVANGKLCFLFESSSVQWNTAWQNALTRPEQIRARFEPINYHHPALELSASGIVLTIFFNMSCVTSVSCHSWAAYSGVDLARGEMVVSKGDLPMLLQELPQIALSVDGAIGFGLESDKGLDPVS